MARTNSGRAVEKLIDDGYVDIIALSQKTGLSERQCRRYLDKHRSEAKGRFDKLMTGGDYLYQYYNVLDNFSKTIQQCNEELNVSNAKYDELEQQIDEALDELDLPKQALAKAQLLGQLVQIQNSRENAVVRITGQRDKATDLKAKVYNSGPVVNAIDNLFRNKTQDAEVSQLNTGEESINVLELAEPKDKISEEDAKIIKKMDDELK